MTRICKVKLHSESYLSVKEFSSGPGHGSDFLDVSDRRSEDYVDRDVERREKGLRR